MRGRGPFFSCEGRFLLVLNINKCLYVCSYLSGVFDRIFIAGPLDLQHSNRKTWQVEQLAFLAKSLGDEKRLRILLAIADGRKSVSAIVEELGFSQPLVSHHLKELRRCLLVRVERNGPFVFYELADRRIIEALGQMQEMAADLLAARNSF